MIKKTILLLILTVVQSSIIGSQSLSQQKYAQAMKQCQEEVEGYKKQQESELQALREKMIQRSAQSTNKQDSLESLRIFMVGEQLIKERYEKLIEQNKNTTDKIINALSKSEY